MDPRCGVVKATKGGKPPPFPSLQLPFMKAKHEEREDEEEIEGGGYQRPDGNSEAHSY